MSLVLIGMRGAGKSATGRLAAARLGSARLIDNIVITI